jgi:hypothetical protein
LFSYCIIEPRSLHMLGKCSTTWAIPLTLWGQFILFFETRSHYFFLPRLASNLSSLCFCLSTSWDYRHGSPLPAKHDYSSSLHWPFVVVVAVVLVTEQFQQVSFLHNTWPYLISKAKQGWAWLILRWELWAFFILNFFYGCAGWEYIVAFSKILIVY